MTESCSMIVSCIPKSFPSGIPSLSGSHYTRSIGKVVRQSFQFLDSSLNSEKTVNAMKHKVSEKITELRKNAKITQQQLSEALNVSSAAVSKWENGISAPDIETLCAIADFFQVSVDTLLGHTSKRRRVAVFLYDCGEEKRVLEVLEDHGGKVVGVARTIHELEDLLNENETVNQVIELSLTRESDYVRKKLEEIADRPNMRMMKVETVHSENLAPLLEKCLEIDPF